jgi:16S rRNA (guanine966-N2)-methyltransferase
VREAVFPAVQALLELDGATVLDLYAGSGAMGLEALSRGAARAVLVENARPALAALRQNLTELDFGPAAETVFADASEWLASAEPRPFDFVYVDPPYIHRVDADLALLAERGWLADGAVVAVERERRDAAFDWPEPLHAVKDKRYGDTTVRYARVGG